MLGSIVAEQVIYQTLAGLPAVTGVVGNRLYGTMAVPPGGTVPALIFYMTQSAYDGQVSLLGADDIGMETVRFDVVTLCQGTSHAVIQPVVHAHLAALSGQSFERTVAGEPYQLTFTAVGETPLTTRMDAGVFYRALGITYEITITRG